jgi:hypothetical protein
MALDLVRNLLITGYTSNAVSRINTSGTATGTFGSGYNTHPESIAFDTFGNAFVGQERGSRDLLKLGPAGNTLAAFDAVPEGLKGTDRIDLASDQCTMLYTSQGTSIKRFNVCTVAQLPDFVTGLPGTEAHEIRILLNGDVLVADTQSILRLNSSGSIVQQYDVAGRDCWTTLAVDTVPSRFYAGDRCSRTVVKFDLASGTVLNSMGAGAKSDIEGLAVNGGITAATAADVSVSTVDLPDPVSASRPGQPAFVRYRSTVANAGPGLARGVTFTISIAGGAIDSAAGDGWSCTVASPTAATCTLPGALGIGASASPIDVVVQSPQTTTATTITATTNVSATEPDPNLANNSAIQSTTVDPSNRPDQYATFCRESGCLGTTVLGVGDNTSSTIAVPPDAASDGGLLLQAEGAHTFPCGDPDTTQELFFAIPDGYVDPTNPIRVELNVIRAGTGVGPNDPICVLKDDPGAVPFELPPCDTPGVATPSPCEDDRFQSGGVLTVVGLTLSGDPKWGH